MTISSLFKWFNKEEPQEETKAVSRSQLVPVRSSSQSEPVLVPVAEEATTQPEAGQGAAATGTRIARPKSGPHQESAAKVRETLQSLNIHEHLTPEQLQQLRDLREGRPLSGMHRRPDPDRQRSDKLLERFKSGETLSEMGAYCPKKKPA